MNDHQILYVKLWEMEKRRNDSRREELKKAYEDMKSSFEEYRHRVEELEREED